MLNLLKENRLLISILSGGLLFLIATITLVSLLLLQPSATESVAMAPATVSPTNTPIPPSEPESTPTPSPTSTTPPTITPSPIAAAGDKLTLPTVTPTVSPSPTATPTPTTTPVPQKVEGLRVGNIAPDFTLGSNRASRVSLSDLRGKIVILNFWASWCPPCRHEVPTLQSIHNEFGPRGVVVLAVNEREKLSDVERFAHDNGINFAVWLDEDGWAGTIYQARSIPTTYFIDEEGIIQAIQIGSMTREQIVAHLEKLL